MANRQETQQQTRAALLRAGEEELLRSGITQTSLRNITAKAGYTLGAFYSNFPTRDAFLLEILSDITERLFDSLDKVIETAISHGVEGGLKDIADWIGQARKHALSDLLLEFSIYAAHDDDFRHLYTPYIISWREHIRHSFERLFEGFGLVSNVPSSIMAAGYSALWQGLTLERIVPVEKADQSLIIWLTLLVNSARETPGVTK